MGTERANAERTAGCVREDEGVASENAPRDAVTAERKRMRPEDRRNAVLDAALKVFAEAGFRRASLSEVSEEAGVTKGCLYHYFDSKEELLLALMRERSHNAAANCLSGGAAETREEALTLMVRSLWRRYEREGQLELTTVALTELPHAPEVARAFFDEVVTRNRAFLRGTLERTRGVGAKEDAGGAERENEPRTAEHPIEVSTATRANGPPGNATEVGMADVGIPATLTSAQTRAAVSDDLVAMLVPYMVMGAALGYRLYRDVDPSQRSSEEIEGALLEILLKGLG